MGGLGVTEFVAGGLIALAAAGLTTMGTYFIERARWRREDKRRFQQDRLQAYARYLSICRQAGLKVHSLSTEIQEAGYQTLQRLQDAQAEVLILASPPVWEAANDLFWTAASERGEDEAEEDYNERKQQEISDKTRMFRKAAQKELGIQIPGSSQAGQHAEPATPRPWWRRLFGG